MGCGEGWGLYIYAVLEAPLSGASRHSLLRLATFPHGQECPCEKWSAAPVSPPCFVRWTRSAQLPPRGEPSVPASISAKFVVRQSCKKVHLTSKFSFTHGRKLGSPRGGTNSDRVQRTKQGAVSGAALRFLQALTRARRKNRLSARGAGETPARAARLRGEQSGAPGPLRRLRRHLPRTRGRQEPKGCVLALPRAGELSSEARLRGLYTKLSPP